MVYLLFQLILLIQVVLDLPIFIIFYYNYCTTFTLGIILVKFCSSQSSPSLIPKKS